MKSASASIEDKIITLLRAKNPGVDVIGLLEATPSGVLKEEDLTAIQVRVYDFAQRIEGREMFTVKVEIRLNVSQSDSANASLFRTAHEAVALWLESVMLDDECTQISTDKTAIDGFQRTGDDKDFDISGGEWYAAWNMTLSGRLLTTNEGE